MVRRSLKYLTGGLVGLVALNPRFVSQVTSDIVNYHSIMSPSRYDIGQGWEQCALTLGCLALVAYGTGKLIKEGITGKI